MGYNTEADKLIKLFEYVGEKNTLLFSLFSYKGAKPKLQIHRSFEKRDKTTGYGKMGRLTGQELTYFLSISNEILEIIDNWDVYER